MIRFGPIYRALLAEHGPQDWWPADSAFEVMAGAMLVQRTSWRNARLAVENLRSRGLLDPGRLRECSKETLAELIRPAGFFRTKARRLQTLAEFAANRGGTDALAAVQTDALRLVLLGLDGIGPETADAILLYAFGRPAVVIDGYLRRLARRLEGRATPPSDGELRDRIEAGRPDASWLNEFHALVVIHGQRVCRADPLCGRCVLNRRCRTGRSASDAELRERVGDLAQDPSE